MSMNKATKSTRVVAILMLLVIMIANITVMAVAVCMTQEETSVVRAKNNITTTNEVFQKVKMPEISLEELESVISETIEETSVQYSAKPSTYVVESGDNLWKIAEKIYHDGSMYPYIMRENNLSSETVYQGQVLNVKYLASGSDEYNEARSYSYDQLSSIQTSAKSNKIPASKDNMTYVGQFRITGYDPWCAHCCGKTNGITSSGREAQVGRTIAASSKYPFGTKLYIEGYGTYVVEDRGGFDSNVIDIAAASHEACYALTASNVNVYIVK